MKKKGIIWSLLMILFAMIFVIPSSREAFMAFSGTHGYIAGFIKVGFLSTMGEILATRITTGQWKLKSYFIVRVLIWGVIGVLLTLMFGIFAGGVTSLQAAGKLPGQGSSFAFAFFTSLIMNTTFAPTFMFAHRLSDTYLDMKADKKEITVKNLAENANLFGFLDFVIKKTILFFWVPAHTFTFMLPAEYRILMAAVLSFVLGILLALGNKKK